MYIYFELKNQKELSIAKSLAYAEFADVIWCETNEPDLGFAKEFSDEIKSKFPNVCIYKTSKNLGTSYTRNAGINFSKGEYILVLLIIFIKHW